MKLNFCREYSLRTELAEQARFFLFRIAASGPLDSKSGMSFSLPELDQSAEQFQKKMDSVKVFAETEIFSMYLAQVVFVDQVERLELEEPASEKTWVWTRSSGRISFRRVKYLSSLEQEKPILKKIIFEFEDQNLDQVLQSKTHYASLQELWTTISMEAGANPAIQAILRGQSPRLVLSEMDPVTREVRVISNL